MPEQFAITAEDRRILREMRAHQRSLQGTGLTNTPGAASFVTAQRRRQRQRIQRPEVVWVEIVASKSGEGVYSCILGRAADVSGFDPTSDGASFAFHTFTVSGDGSFDAYFVNKAEEGKGDPHWLDDGGHYPGTIVGVASDDYPIVLGHAFDTEICVEGP